MRGIFWTPLTYAAAIVVLRAIDVKAHTNDPVRVLTETDYSAVIRGTVYPSARLIWSVPLEDARYWHNAYNVLTVDPVIGARSPPMCAPS